MYKNKIKALLALEDGSVFSGISLGSKKTVVGELIFNTSMTGYQEVMTDPSYAGQVVAFTYPHIGNVGINIEDMESKQVWLSGIIIKEISNYTSNWRASESLEDFLYRFNVSGIADIDTRQITRILRNKGTQKCCIMHNDINVREAINLAQQSPSLDGKDMTSLVSTNKSYAWSEKSCSLKKRRDAIIKRKAYHIVVYDFGVKYSILRRLADRGCQITVVPSTVKASEILFLKPDGIVLSNGPGDPAACHEIIKNIRTLVKKNIPIFGVCLGHQLLGLACGAKIERLKFGHHGINHPIFDLDAGKVLISSQNHGFSIKREDLPKDLFITHTSLFDGTVQGIKANNGLAFGTQGHPEASPGPLEMNILFEHFFNIIRRYSSLKKLDDTHDQKI